MPITITTSSILPTHCLPIGVAGRRSPESYLHIRPFRPDPGYTLNMGSECHSSSRFHTRSAGRIGADLVIILCALAPGRPNVLARLRSGRRTAVGCRDRARPCRRHANRAVCAAYFSGGPRGTLARLCGPTPIRTDQFVRPDDPDRHGGRISPLATSAVRSNCGGARRRPARSLARHAARLEVGNRLSRRLHAFGSALILYNEWLYGQPYQNTHDHAGFNHLAGTVNGFFGLLVDAQWGLLIAAPVLVLAIAAVPWWWVAARRTVVIAGAATSAVSDPGRCLQGLVGRDRGPPGSLSCADRPVRRRFDRGLAFARSTFLAGARQEACGLRASRLPLSATATPSASTISRTASITWLTRFGTDPSCRYRRPVGRISTVRDRTAKRARGRCLSDARSVRHRVSSRALAS